MTVQGVIWLPFTVGWPTLPWGGQTLYMVYSFFGKMTYVGAFLAYWATVAAMYFSFIHESPPWSGSPYAQDSTEVYTFIGGYAGLCLVDSVVSYLFVSDIIDFYALI